MSEVERRLSVQEKIEQLERNKITLHPPIFDSKLNLTGKKSPPDAESNAPETQRNTIRVIKTNEAENIKVELSIGGKNTDDNKKMESNTVIEENLRKMDSEDGKVPSADTNTIQNNTVNENENLDEEIEKDLDTEKQTDNKMETLEESRSDLKVSKNKEPNSSKDNHKETVNSSETVEEIKSELKVKKEEKQTNDKNMKDKTDHEIKTSQENDSQTTPAMDKGKNTKNTAKPIVQLTDAEIDKIVEKYAGRFKDKKVLEKYLDFFFDMDRPHFGYFTVEMLMSKLYRDGCRFTEEKIVTMFCDLDKDNDFLVSLDDYLDEMSKPPRRTLNEEELKDWFKRLDLDNDGFLSRDDITTSIDQISGYPLGIYKLEEMMAWDRSGKGKKLDFEEFCLCYKHGRRTSNWYSCDIDWFNDLVPNLTTIHPAYYAYRRRDVAEEKNA